MMHTILVVDDMAVIREPVAASLRLAGYQTLLAGDGREAFEIAEAEAPDLILLDLAMPEMHGLVFLREQRKHERLRDIPVILLTAVTERHYVAEAAKLGVRDYLLKSQFSMSELVARVERRLKEHPAMGEADQQGQASLKGMEEMDAEMSASEIAEHIHKSPELKSLLDEPAEEELPEP